MKRLLVLALGMVSFAAMAAVSPGNGKAGKLTASPHKLTASSAKLTASQIVSKNVAARGGLKAWRAVKTLSLSGRMEAGGKQNATLPFVMKMKRPHMSRLEIRFQDQTAVQVYDGAHGWKVRPFLGRDEVEPYTATEAKAASGWQELDGPLIDYASKGTRVKLEGMEAVEKHNAYKLKLTLKNGAVRHVWVDAKTFLETKIEGDPRMLDGKLRNTVVYYRDYGKEGGLTVPHVMETVVDGGKEPHKLYIEHVAVNQPMEQAIFAKPKAAAPQDAAFKPSAQ